MLGRPFAAGAGSHVPVGQGCGRHYLAPFLDEVAGVFDDERLGAAFDAAVYPRHRWTQDGILGPNGHE